ncbi:acetyl-CoA hydrolase/transferase family protein [Chloroflexota bacterium]
MHKLEPVSAQEAIKTIKPGSTVFIGESCGEPQTLVEALIARKEELKGTCILDSRRFTGSLYAPFGDYFKIISFQLSPDNYKEAHSGRIDFLPLKLSEMRYLFAPDGPLQVDVAMVQVSPPDDKGYCSFGVSVGYTLDAARAAKTVIAEVNDNMPRTYSGNGLPLDKFDYIINTSRPLLEYPAHEIGDRHMMVAQNVLRLIGDGATLSLGIGGIPEAVLKTLKGKRNIGIHTGLITDEIIAPVEEGIINNTQKNIDRGITVSAAAMGSSKLFRFLHENPRVEMRPYSYTHDIDTIRQLDSLIVINSAIEIDLTGQVNGESIGNIQFSGVGGQADFVRGAALSKGGRVIIALTSTARKDAVSKIVSQLKAGTAVTTPRYDVQYVVTEYGIAELWGKTISQRAEALISIAHPDFRKQLYNDWQSQKTEQS